MLEKINNIRVEITSQVRENTRKGIILKGLYYIVPLDKYDYYGEEELEKISVSPEAARYLDKFIPEGDGQSIAVDLEHTLHFATLPEEIGLGESSLGKMERGLCALALIPQTLLKNPNIRELIEKNISNKDKSLIEFDMFDPTASYLGPASIMRADLLLTPGGKALCCDPNLVPLGYAVTSAICGGIADKAKLPVGASSDYLEGILKEVLKYPDRLSGILTGINYPNWPSHKILCNELREKFGIPFYVIPADCLNGDGTVDFQKINAFNKAFGIQPIPEEISSNVPGVLIRYSRENTQFHPSTEIVNKPGIRMLETQLWEAVLALPGMEQIAIESGIDPCQLKEAVDITVPTLVARRNGNKIEIATAIKKDADGKLAFNWESISPIEKEGDPAPRLDVLVGMLWGINCQEKPSELSWFIKTLTTSGKKGVRFTGDGRIDQTVKNLSKVLDKMGMEDGKIFLVQPKVRSVINDNGQELRIKTDFYLSFSTGKCVALDYMATPIEQRTAHGSSATRLGVVLRNGK